MAKTPSKTIGQVQRAPPDERLISASSARLPPLALVVGFHDRHHIFESDDEHHRPEDETEHAIDVQLVGFDRMMAGEGFAESVERAGADIAENDADGADRQLQRAVTVMAVTRLARFDSGGRGAFGACLTLLRLDSHWPALDQRERQE